MSSDSQPSESSGPQLLFIYGTLHPDHAPEEMVSDVKRLILVDAATVQGQLFQLEEYPALVVKTDTLEAIHGFVFELPSDSDAPALLARLDAYEGFLPDSPETSLFLRERITATLADDSVVTAWAYLYNRQLTVLITD